MKKIIVCALLLGLFVSVASPVFAWDAAKQMSLGQDKNKLTWYLLDYGRDENSVPYALVRKYYTNETIKNDTIEQLMSKYAIDSNTARGLYFTEYEYEYTKDGKQFALTYLKHYNMVGNEIHGTVYGTDSNPKTFSAVPAGLAPAKALTYAMKQAPAARKIEAPLPEQRTVAYTPVSTPSTPSAPVVNSDPVVTQTEPKTVEKQSMPVRRSPTISSAPATSWDSSKQVSLGLDKNKLTWYLLDYGKDKDGVPYAVARKYYTNEKIKNETIELLMSKYAISPAVASQLYFTEYRYEYTPDGKQFALSYLRHYDRVGEEIHGTIYGDDSNPKTFAGIPAGQTPAKGVAYAFGKASPSSGNQASATGSKSSTVPANRVVRATKK